ncbi:MAG: hypothetical protein Q6354_07260 [Candidatus Brocadiales bacterium]|nr:hypothetical protein [Candidatus Brocadiales bacterium]
MSTLNGLLLLATVVTVGSLKDLLTRRKMAIALAMLDLFCGLAVT